jgi:hypothetical protein
MLYIIKGHHNDYESSLSTIVGVCKSKDKAIEYALRIVMKSIEYYLYDPQRRYHEDYDYLRDKKVYRDTWSEKQNCSEYLIEEWEFDNEKGKRLNRWYINIDKLIKNEIVEKQILSSKIENYIELLINDIDKISLCVENKKQMFGKKWSERNEPEINEVETWNKYYNQEPAEIIFSDFNT